MLSELLAFLLGTAVGAAGQYFASRFTDQRRRQEARRESKKQFLKVKTTIPKLIAEMHEDLTKPENDTIRHFLVLATTPDVPPSGGGRGARYCLAYYEDAHENLKGKITILENHGYVFDVTTGNASKYQLTEEFIELVRNAGA